MTAELRHGGAPPRAPSTSSHMQTRKVEGVDEAAIGKAVGALQLVLDERTGRYVTIVDGHRGARIRVVVEVIREPRADGAG